MGLEDKILHPGALILGAVATLSTWLGIPWLDAVLVTIWSQSGTVFTALSIASGTIASTVPFVGQTEVRIAAAVAGLLFFAKLATQFLDRLESNIENDT